MPALLDRACSRGQPSHTGIGREAGADTPDRRAPSGPFVCRSWDVGQSDPTTRPFDWAAAGSHPDDVMCIVLVYGKHHTRARPWASYAHLLCSVEMTPETKSGWRTPPTSKMALGLCVPVRSPGLGLADGYCRSGLLIHLRPTSPARLFRR